MNTGFVKLTDNNQKETLELRNSVEIIRSRAKLLDEPDRTLIITYLDNENSFRQIAKLIGVNEVTIARRIKKIMRRLENNISKTAHKKLTTLDAKERKIARDYFIKGLSLRKLSKKYRATRYKVRKIISIVEKTTATASSKINERKY